MDSELEQCYSAKFELLTNSLDLAFWQTFAKHSRKLRSLSDASSVRAGLALKAVYSALWQTARLFIIARMIADFSNSFPGTQSVALLVLRS